MNYEELHREFGPLATQDHSTRYAQGDLLVEARPLPSELSKLAADYGYTVQTLRTRMAVAEAFPPGHQVRKIPFTIAERLANGLDTQAERETVLARRPLMEWSVNSIQHAILQYQKENGRERFRRNEGPDPMLDIPGYGRIYVREAVDGGKVVVVAANASVRGSLRRQDSPNEIRLVVTEGE